MPYSYLNNKPDNKHRIELNDLKKAISYRKKYGGWIVKTAIKIFWYSYQYTTSEIFSDIPGNLEIYWFKYRILEKPKYKTLKKVKYRTLKIYRILGIGFSNFLYIGLSNF